MLISKEMSKTMFAITECFSVIRDICCIWTLPIQNSDVYCIVQFANVKPHSHCKITSPKFEWEIFCFSWFKKKM